MKQFNNKGSMFVVLIIAMTVIATLGAVFVSMVVSKQQGFTLLLNGHRANMIARAGIEWAIRFASDGNPVDGSRDFVPGSPNEGSFSASYNDNTGVLTVDGTYRGTTQRITLTKFRQYLRIGDISFPLTPMKTSFIPVESQAGGSIVVEETGVIHLGLGALGTSGAVWYGGNSAAGNCVNGSCDFGSGFRAYFVFQFAPNSKGDGFTFAIMNGANNAANSVGGDSNMGELMAYGGDSRLYDGHIYSFVDGVGKGLRPPKFAIEFDIYPNECPTDPTDSCNSDNRCDPPNEQHMAYVFWGDNNRIGCKDEYTRWIKSFSFPVNSVVYGTTYLYRLMGNLTTGTAEPAWPLGKGSTVTESGVQWQECSWRKNVSYDQGEVVAPSILDPAVSYNGFFFRESRVDSQTTSPWSEPNWTNCVSSGFACIDNQARWQNAYFYVPQLSVNYATNSSTYDDNKHLAGTGSNPTNTTTTGDTTTTPNVSYYKSSTNPTKWLADRTSSTTVNTTYAYRMEVVRDSTARTYRIKSWIVACDPIWSALTEYTIYAQVRPTVDKGFYYIAANDGKSGTAEPNWLSPNPDGTVTDGTVRWVPVQIPTTWKSGTYLVGDQVKPTTNKGYYYMARTAGTSSDTEPTWSASQMVTDGMVTWIPVPMPVCDKYTNGTLGNVAIDYIATSPTLDRTVTLDATYNTAFNKFLFGWTTASGGATQKADVWKFRLTFKP